MAAFRSKRMPSPDGRGVAKGRWHRVELLVERLARRLRAGLIGLRERRFFEMEDGHVVLRNNLVPLPSAATRLRAWQLWSASPCAGSVMTNRAG